MESKLNDKELLPDQKQTYLLFNELTHTRKFQKPFNSKGLSKDVETLLTDLMKHIHVLDSTIEQLQHEKGENCNGNMLVQI